MRVVIQRVKKAKVNIEGECVAEIGQGLLVLAGVGRSDRPADIDYIVEKIVNMRIFERDGKFDLSVLDMEGEVLAVSNFTLYGDVRKGRRPSFTDAMSPGEASPLFERFIEALSNRVSTKSGRFQAMMEVELVNDGPVTVLIDSERF